jgi:Flp pilus assembly protein TadG
MITLRRRWAGSRADRSQEGGYVAVMTALLLVVLMGLAAFAVDVGRWYVVGQQEQRAADAAALAGVTNLPGDLNGPNGAIATAKNFSKVNGFEHNVNGTAVTAGLDASGRPTRLRVTVSRTVGNIFGSLMGIPTTIVSRTAVADFGGPVPLGSPCNEFGDDPDAGGNRSTNCVNAGAFWANVGSPKATKVSGDAYQNNVCTTANDGCPGSVNTDYDPDGYFYTVTLKQPVTNLRIQAFDPAQVVVGDTCTNTTGSSGNNLTLAAALGAKAVVPSARYVAGSGVWCTGDTKIGSGSDNGLVKTEFTVRDPGVNDWDPKSWLPHSGCTQTFSAFNGDLSKALDQTLTPHNTTGKFQTAVAANFRRWVDLCNVGTVPAGTYAIQVKTNGLGADLESGHNRFALRAFGSGAGDNDNIAVAGFTKMAMYGNTPNGTSRFFLAKVPSDVKGQLFNVRLFDIGDGAVSGSTIKVLPPSELGPSATFSDCTGTGVVNGALANCQISVSSSYNGKRQTISVPIPSSYACDDDLPTGCWVRLEFFYGSGSNPADTTTWNAGLDGDPVRLVE